MFELLVIYPKRSWKTTYEQGLMSEEKFKTNNDMEKLKRRIRCLLKMIYLVALHDAITEDQEFGVGRRGC